MSKYCKYDEAQGHACHWVGESTPEDCINCQLFAMRGTLSRILRAMEKASEEVLKKEKEK